MLTFREARQRLEQYEMSIRRVGASTDFVVTYNEDTGKAIQENAFRSDCIETCMLEGISMRRRRGAIAA